MQILTSLITPLCAKNKYDLLFEQDSFSSLEYTSHYLPVLPPPLHDLMVVLVVLVLDIPTSFSELPSPSFSPPTLKEWGDTIIKIKKCHQKQ